ncbi:hypothetical protein N0V93_000137 [Gnomoniopsis smithogilvyi]|uniref:Uncharacterized protein n=1 Tax=Gnomoniopsis smithogilvyi TaxID=1191159 RepID=A0A9W8YZ43_9PEZI|nr:hypothetical protein N0V93_000137 [Gnomoniopsis smithogilvyi]
MSSIARDGILNDDTSRIVSKSVIHHRRDRDDDRTRSASPADQVKHEDGGPDVRMADAKPTYKSWKKKYRKMRIKFDNLQAQNEELYQMEQRALARTKQLAIQNDRMLDLLLDTNNCAQIPTDKRYDLSLPIPSDAEEDCILPIDREPKSGPRPAKTLRELIQDVPHFDFAATAKLHPDAVNDLLHGIDSPAADASHQQHPPAMLTADDIDNYLWEIDNRVAREPEVYGGPSEMLPTLAPLAREPQSGATPTPVAHSKAGSNSQSTASRDFALRNPTSVYNWLRKHAPKTFLQDHEGGDDKKEKSHHRKAPRVEDDDDDEEKRPPAKKSAGGSARKSSGEARGSIAVARAKAKTERASKRSSAAQAKDKRKPLDVSMVDAEDEVGYDEPAPSKGKRKRPADDDTGYRPKGGASRRPAKKRSKNNSTGGSSAAGPLTGAAGADDKAEVIAGKHADKIEDEVDVTAGASETED